METCSRGTGWYKDEDKHTGMKFIEREEWTGYQMTEDEVNDEDSNQERYNGYKSLWCFVNANIWHKWNVFLK